MLGCRPILTEKQDKKLKVIYSKVSHSVSHLHKTDLPKNFMIHRRLICEIMSKYGGKHLAWFIPVDNSTKLLWDSFVELLKAEIFLNLNFKLAVTSNLSHSRVEMDPYSFFSVSPPLSLCSLPWQTQYKEQNVVALYVLSGAYPFLHHDTGWSSEANIHPTSY